MATPSLHNRQFLGTAWLTLPLLLTPATTRANVGPPSSGGQVVAEPVGIKDVEITRESLTIDLQPLGQNGRVQVEAVYQVHNHGAEKTLDLLFASGSAGVANFHVWLGDQPITTRPANNVPLPQSWRTPLETPKIFDERKSVHLDYDVVVVPIALTVVIPPGQHTLKVRYESEAATNLLGAPTVYRQFAYVLAPARSWSRFGGLDVSVHLPADWRAACTPALAREGDTLRGGFDGLPADAIALTVQAPEGWAYQPVAFGSLGLLALTGLGGAFVCWRVGRVKGRRPALPAVPHPNWLQRHGWPLSLGMGVVWGLAILGAGMIATFGPDWVLPAGQVSHYGYGQPVAVLGVLFMSILAVPVGFALAQTAAVIARR